MGECCARIGRVGMTGAALGPSLTLGTEASDYIDPALVLRGHVQCINRQAPGQVHRHCLLSEFRNPLPPSLNANPEFHWLMPGENVSTFAWAPMFA